MSDKGTALITGGAGFIGSHLSDLLLAEGQGVRVLDNLTTGSRENLQSTVELQVGDILDPEACLRACQGVHTVYHMAAKVSIRHSLESFHEDAAVNLMGTLNVLRAAAAGGAKRFVLTSSMGVYTDSPYGQLVPETHRAEPLSPYGISKLAAEKYVLMMAPRLGMSPVVLRLFNTYGTRQGYTPYVGVITIFITNLLQGKPITIFGDGMQCRDFVHVADVARALYLAGTVEGATGGVFNVGTGRGTTVKDLVGVLFSHLGEVEVKHAERQDSELYYSVPDISRAKSVLGYKATHKLEEGLADVIGYIKSRL